MGLGENPVCTPMVRVHSAEVDVQELVMHVQEPAICSASWPVCQVQVGSGR